jgi:hypothetical protein
MRRIDVLAIEQARCNASDKGIGVDEIENDVLQLACVTVRIDARIAQLLKNSLNITRISHRDLPIKAADETR